MRIEKNYKWIDILPTVMIDWGHSMGVRLFIGWIYWTIEVRLTQLPK